MPLPPRSPGMVPAEYSDPDPKPRRLPSLSLCNQLPEIARPVDSVPKPTPRLIQCSPASLVTLNSMQAEETNHPPWRPQNALFIILLYPEKKNQKKS